MQQKVTPTVDEYIRRADELFQARDQFEREVLARTHQQLYELLGDVLQLYLDMKEKGQIKETLKVIADRLSAKGQPVQRNTPALSVLIRFVFDTDRKRVYVYSKALLAAIDDGVQPSGLPDYIQKAGGLEDIKRNRAVSGAANEKKVELEFAISEVSRSYRTAQVLAKLSIGKDSVKLDDDTEYAFLVARKNSYGDLEVVAPIPRTTKALESTALKIIGENAIAKTNEAKKQQKKQQDYELLKETVRSALVPA
jgi:hypothetical protein